MKQLLHLFCSFFKIGLFTFGGGYAMLPLLQDELVRKRKWTTDEELLDYYSIGQCTPGVIAVNVSTFIGYKQKGIIGGCVSTLGMITPSLLIIMLIAAVLAKYMHNQYLSYAFAGIRIAVTALIADTLLGLWKKGIKDNWAIFIFSISTGLLLWLNLSAIWIVAISSIAGIGIYKFGKKSEKNK